MTAAKSIGTITAAVQAARKRRGARQTENNANGRQATPAMNPTYQRIPDIAYTVETMRSVDQTALRDGFFPSHAPCQAWAA